MDTKEAIIYRRSTPDPDDLGPVLKNFRARVLKVDREKFRIEHFITTDDIDRYSEILRPEGALLENFLRAKGPVLFGHGWGGTGRGSLPIGKNVGLVVGENDKKRTGLIATTEFYRPGQAVADLGVIDTFPLLIWDMWLQEVISGTSVGFMPVKLGQTEFAIADLPDNVPKPRDPDIDVVKLLTYLVWELLEYSVVPVPANPGTVVPGRPDEEKKFINPDDVKSFLEEKIRKGDLTPEELLRWFPPEPGEQKSVLGFVPGPTQKAAERLSGMGLSFVPGGSREQRVADNTNADD